MGVLDLGFPLWLLVSVLVVFALLLYYMLGGRVSEGLRVPLAIVLAPVCTVAAVAVAVVLSALLSPFFETPTSPAEPQAQDPAGDHPDTIPLEPRVPDTIARQHHRPPHRALHRPLPRRRRREASQHFSTLQPKDPALSMSAVEPCVRYPRRIAD